MAAGILMLRKPGYMVIQSSQLEGDRARIGFIGQQKLQHKIGLQGRKVACAIGDGTVGNMEQHLQVGLDLGWSLGQTGAQQVGELQGALESAADVEEQPTVAA